jgi:hypothetical protein
MGREPITMIKSDNILFCSLETDDKVLRNNYCIKSANHFGIRLEVFGADVEWKGFITKVEILNEELNRLKHKYDLVMFVDLRDTMFWADKKTILKRLEEINYFNNARMVFNAETNCFPYDGFKKDMKERGVGNKYCFLNSGMFIGDIHFVSICLREICENFENPVDYLSPPITDKIWNDDQFHWQALFMNNEIFNYVDERNILQSKKPYPIGDISLDYHCRLFQTIGNEDGGRNMNFDLIINEDYIFNQNTKSYPLLFHSTGPSGTLAQFEKLLDSK